MATNEDGADLGAATIDLGDEALRVGDIIEHEDFGPITATRIVAEGFGKTAYFALEARETDLAISLTAEQLRDDWGETVARDPFDLAEGGDA